MGKQPTYLEVPVETIGQAIRVYRSAQGYDLRELAKLSGVAHSTIHRIEQGANSDYAKILQIVDALNAPSIMGLPIGLQTPATTPKGTQTT